MKSGEFLNINTLRRFDKRVGTGKRLKDYLMSVLAFALSVAVVTCGILPVEAAFAANESYAEDRAVQAADTGQESRIIEAKAPASKIEKYGNLVLNYAGGDLTINVLNDYGYEYGDIVTVTIGEQKIDMPLCGAYQDVEQGEAVLSAKDSRTAKIGMNMKNFAEKYGIAEMTVDQDKNFYWTFKNGYSDPLTVYISMKEKGGYLNEYKASQLFYTDKRMDFSDLTDEEFANFREVRTTGIGDGILYRTSSPLDDYHKRNEYSDNALRKAGVTVVMNLTDSYDDAKKYAGYKSSYFSKTNYIALSMGMDYNTEDFRNKLAEGLRYFVSNKGVYAVHCREGKDRTGIVCALIECLMGATYEEVADDYMKTYFNYYKVEKGDDLYGILLRRNLDKTLQNLFGLSDLTGADLASEAERYFKEIGLTDNELSALRENLSLSKNPLAVKAKTAGLKYSSLKKHSRTLKVNNVIKFVKKGRGTVSYSIESAKKGSKSFAKSFRINTKTGKLTVKNGLKKGTYKIRIKVSASGDSKYIAASKTVTFKLKIR